MTTFYSQTFVMSRGTYDSEALRERVMQTGMNLALRGAQGAGHTVATDDEGNIRSEHHWDHFEEYPIVVDEDGEPVLDRDGRFIDDISQPQVKFSRLTVDLPITEGNPS